MESSEARRHMQGPGQRSGRWGDHPRWYTCRGEVFFVTHPFRPAGPEWSHSRRGPTARPRFAWMAAVACQAPYSSHLM